MIPLAIPRGDRRRRMVVVGGVMAAMFAAVAGRAIYLHTTSHRDLQWIARKQYHAVMPTARRRAKIVDTRGRDLAVSVPVQSVFADPSSVADPGATLDAINQIMPLGDSRRQVERRMRPDRKFAWIKRRIAPDLAAQIQALALPGIHFVEESLRVYPNGDLASQVLGAVGYDADPLAGLELVYDDALLSKKSAVVYQRDARGRVYLSPVGFSEQDDVGTMTLTIDKIVQYVTEQALDRAHTSSRAQSATAVVVDVQTGKILALANRPTFDPNAYFRFPQETWRNRAVTDTFEPGSTFKTLIVAAALETGMNPQRRFDCEHGSLRVGRAVLHDSHAYGMLSVADVIRVSSNIGALKIASEVGKTRIAGALRAFGIGERTGIDFPGEAAGILRNESGWQPVEFATIAFGQGVTATPLQMAMAFAAIANDGVLMQPYLVDRITSRDGEVLHVAAPHAVRRVVSPGTAQTMRAILQRVVGEGGTGMLAASSLYETAGKTGTAQKVVANGRGYAPGKYFASFVGFAPADQPRIAVFVGIDEPVGPYFGGQVAAPVFREIVEATLQYLEVPASGAPVILTERAVTDTGLPARVHEAALARREPTAFVRAPDGKMIVPDLAGLAIRQVVRLAGEADLPLRVRGNGVAVAQRPAAGTMVGREQPLEVHFELPE